MFIPSKYLPLQSVIFVTRGVAMHKYFVKCIMVKEIDERREVKIQRITYYKVCSLYRAQSIVRISEVIRVIHTEKTIN
jgi:hypothetical protein